MTELLEERGIKVALLHGPDDFDGACAATQDGQHVLIALNAERPGERMRFTAAHELGHWVMKVPCRHEAKDVETCCHRFSGCIPLPGFLRDCRFRRTSALTGSSPRTSDCQSSITVVDGRCVASAKDLSLLGDTGYQYSSIQFSKNGWRKEAGSLPETPRRFESLVFWGLAETFSAKSRAAEFLQQPLSALDPSLTGPLGIQ